MQLSRQTRRHLQSYCDDANVDILQRHAYFCCEKKISLRSILTILGSHLLWTMLWTLYGLTQMSLACVDTDGVWIRPICVGNAKHYRCVMSDIRRKSPKAPSRFTFCPFLKGTKCESRSKWTKRVCPCGMTLVPCNNGSVKVYMGCNTGFHEIFPKVNPMYRSAIF